MIINQRVIDETVQGTIDYISYLSDKYLNMILIGDRKLRETEDRLMYIVNLKKSLYNYSYATEFFTDDEIRHLIEQITIVTDELPNNSLYGGA